ncbi:hypothetical protein C6P40_001439 [Pichia californica]|uniref:DUF7907 domain-containing protein n=1 Tax=Pichia californica TaxID=460514 RepID=A0A9P7BGB1_9ASCO|nr:hypothetical protein C6P42_001367 [[Candida] californica]KAG0688083.1 hypothetical protein C6P40_001439 [[Candida] californica]
MLFKNIVTIAASAAIASAEDVYLTVKSDDSSINGNVLGFPHEGAGLNYFFLGTGSATAFTYDESAKEISYPFAGSYTQFFTVFDNFVAFSVASANTEITFEDNVLALNGSTSNFYACKDTNDPYSYSTRSYELMWYASDAPSGCLPLTLVNSGSAAASSSALPSSTSASSAAPSASTYEGSAVKYAPAGAAALLAGAAAALI